MIFIIIVQIRYVLLKLEKKLFILLQFAKLRETVKPVVVTSSNADKYTVTAMKGYLLLAAEEASFSKEQINALLGGMMKALSNYDKVAAENKFLSR